MTRKYFKLWVLIAAVFLFLVTEASASVLPDPPAQNTSEKAILGDADNVDTADAPVRASDDRSFSTENAERPVPQPRHRTKRTATIPAEDRWHGSDSKGMDMTLPDHPLVAKYIRQYDTKEGKKWLSAVIKRAYPYRSYIDDKIRTYNMPPELVYLPVIESSYVVTAHSRSGALGIWQFMLNSIAPFGIRTSEWLDERYDPWKSTDAALKKLKENHDILGSWELALAAYNCGLGAVRKAIKKADSTDYWYLADNHYLPDQTRNYVPKFLAVSHLLSQSGRYGIDTDWDLTSPEIITIPVKRTADLSILAEECGIDSSELRKANPSLLYGITPPDMTYNLNVPAESAAAVADVLVNNNKLLVKYYIYKIKSGDTFYALAQHYGISIDMLQQYNQKLKPSNLRIGAKVIIPAFKEVSPYAGKKRNASLVFNGTYTVRKGDTLWSIALDYDVQVETLAEENKMDTNSILSTGKQLRVPILKPDGGISG